MRLHISSWYPYRHQAEALRQLLAQCADARITIVEADAALPDNCFGPFLVAVEGDADLPIIGVPAIVEAMSRRHPDCAILPRDPVARSLARALGGRIEEILARLAIADIGSYAGFTRPVWHAGSAARATILDDFPARIATLDEFHTRGGTRFLAGDQPSLADCLMAALWWTAEDQVLDEILCAHPSLANWHAANCRGAPFARPGER